MTVNIKKLLREIFNAIKSNQRHSSLITYEVMDDKLSDLEKSDSPSKQELMIYQVLGSIFNDLIAKKINSILIDQYYAEFTGPPLTYQNLDHFSKADGKKMALDELLYSLGRFIFISITKYPQRRDNFLALFQPDNSYGKTFPHINRLAHKVNCLVDFCISHKDFLDVEEIEIDCYSNTRSAEPFQIKDIEPNVPRPTNVNLSFLVIGGFITVFGIVAVSLAFAVLTVGTAGMSLLAVAGFAGLVGGIGLLGAGTYKHRQHVIDESYEHLSDFERNSYSESDGYSTN